MERKKLKLDMMVSDSTIVEKWREHAPFSYSLKINSFSQFGKATPSSDHKYRLRRFESGGYNWRLIVYPNGNEKDEGSGFISMYVEIDTASLMATPPKEAKRFNTLRTIWGFPQVISLDTFNDPKNGYIFDGDECEFGVDVIVAPSPTNCETLSFDNKLSNPKFSWTLKKFSELKQESYKSESFSRGGKSWVLMLYPKGETEMMDGGWLSIFLHLADSEAQKLKEDEKIYVQTQLQLFDPSGSNHLKRELTHWFDKTITNWGYKKTIDEVRKMYLDKEDGLKVEIEFEVVSATN